MIKNKKELIKNGTSKEFKELRQDALDILDLALKSVDPKKAILQQVKFQNEILSIQENKITVSKTARIFVIGGGKAAGSMAEAIEEIIGDRIDSGIINILQDTKQNYNLSYIEMNEASHPIPNQNGVNGIFRMMNTVNNLTENDVVITLISGGGSALMPFPAEDITLDDIQEITSKLLMSGANINEINSVRKHLSAFKGGQLARHCFPAIVISLIISDVISDPIDTIASGPTAPDNTTFKTAKEILEKHHLWETSSINIKRRIQKGFEEKIPDTPKEDDPIFKKVSNFIIANNKIAVQKSLEKAEKLGYNSIVFSTFLEGEAREVGKVYAGIIKEIVINKRPIEPPCAIIIGGETTVTVKGNGIGGRNQELALSAVEYIKGLNCVLATLGTDGIDGISKAAGSIVDGSSYERGINKELKIEKILEDNNSFQFFKELNDYIMTGPTGTNVNDLLLILVS